MTEPKGKGPIFCRKDGEWKAELDERLKTDERVTLMALGNVKIELLKYLDERKDIEILSMETRYIRKREKGMGIKVKVKRSKIS